MNFNELYTGNLKWLPNSVLFLTVHGSRCYRTHTPASDYDYKGFCVPLKKYFHGFMNRFEQAEQNEPDLVVYDIRKFFQLASMANPNILEVLFTDPSDHVVKTKLGQKVLDHKYDFLSSRVKYSFSGYALSQLKRLRGHYAWLTKKAPTKPSREEYGLPSDTKLSSSVMGAFHKLQDQGYGFGVDIMDVMEREKRYAQALKEYRQYEHWKKHRNPERAKLEAKVGYDCYSDDTEFLTSNGWKLYDEIAYEDKLATVFIPKPYAQNGIKTSYKLHGEIEYQNYIDRFEGNYTGPMYNFYGYHTDVLVTPNHRMLARKKERNTGKTYDWELEEASRLPETFEVFRYPTPIVRNFKGPKQLEGLPISTTTFMRLMGWFLSDGSFSFRNGKIKALTISQKDKGKLSPSMKKFANKYSNLCNLYCYTREPNGFNSNYCDELVLRITNHTIKNLMYEFCGHSKEKRIPSWVFSCSKRLQKALLKGLIAGDGTVFRPDNSQTYYSSVKNLANDVQTLAIHAGYETSLYGPYNHQYPGKPSCTMYQVHVNETREQYKQLSTKKNVKKVQVENQRIVCFTVPNSTLITRRNGHIGIHGNSKHAYHLVRLMRMCEEMLTTGEVHVKRPDASQLLEIRNGAWSYEYLISWAESKDLELQELYKKTSLPKNPNTKKLDELCCEVVEEFHNQP